jgi:ABC-type transporter Mla MlaB component
MAHQLMPIVKLSGSITVGSIQGAFEEIKNAFGPAGLEVDLSGITDIDLTFVQLIESARQSAAKAGAAIRLSAPASGFVLETLRRGGFLSDPPDARTLFWAGAGDNS